MPDHVETVGNILEERDRLGGNSNVAPLSEVLTDETRALVERADKLVASAERAAVTDDDTMAKATSLAAMLADHESMVERDRTARKAPVLEAGRTIDGHFNGIKERVATARKKVMALMDAYRRDKEAKAAAERRRLEEEARQAREEAERAQREAAERAASAAPGDAVEAVDLEIEARQRTDEAAALEQQAAAITAAPIRGAAGGTALVRKTYRAEITDLTAALRHCRKVDEASVRACVEQIYARQVRAGVRDLPGATVIEDSALSIRR